MVMKDQIVLLLTDILKDMGITDVTPEIDVPEDASHGDYTTNVAMILAKTLKKSPMEIALQVKERVESRKCPPKADQPLAEKVESEVPDQNIGKPHLSSSAPLASWDTLSAIDRVEVAPPGFINVFLTEASLISQMNRLLKLEKAVGTGQDARVTRHVSRKNQDMTHDTLPPDTRAKRVLVEFAHPNTHKAFHIGHLRNITTGESIVRLLEARGNEVIRANYQGDVGMHIAKCLYSIFHNSHWPHATHWSQKSLEEKVEFLGKAYAAGSKAFDDDPSAREQIGGINQKIYAKDPAVYGLYRETRQWSLDYFEAIYRRVGIRFDRYYFESEVYEEGKNLVREGLKKGIFEESDGAIIFPGTKYGLHNRVFVTGEGNATYEGKELALATMETADHGKLDRIIHVVGPEQASFFTVTFKAEELLGIVRPGVQHHLIYGWVKLKHGKMSSRSGNVVLGEWLLEEAKKSIYDILDKSESKYTKGEQEEIAEKAAVAAVKYAFLKVGTTSEIAFDIKESVNFQGDSGPYLQYTYARCKSVLRKAKDVIGDLGDLGDVSLNPEERAVLRLLSFFPDVVAEAAKNLSPSTLCTYLFKLAQSYNLFYAKHSILVSRVKSHVSSKNVTHDTLTHDTAKLRLALTAATAQVLKNGLYLLGIETLEQM